MKNLKNQTLVIIKYSVYAFKCAKNLIIMLYYFLYELSLKMFIERMFFIYSSYLYMPNNVILDKFYIK